MYEPLCAYKDQGTPTRRGSVSLPSQCCDVRSVSAFLVGFSIFQSIIQKNHVRTAKANVKPFA